MVGEGESVVTHDKRGRGGVAMKATTFVPCCFPPKLVASRQNLSNRVMLRRSTGMQEGRIEMGASKALCVCMRVSLTELLGCYGTVYL